MATSSKTTKTTYKVLEPANLDSKYTYKSCYHNRSTYTTINGYSYYKEDQVFEFTNSSSSNTIYRMHFYYYFIDKKYIKKNGSEYTGERLKRNKSIGKHTITYEFGGSFLWAGGKGYTRTEILNIFKYALNFSDNDISTYITTYNRITSIAELVSDGQAHRLYFSPKVQTAINSKGLAANYWFRRATVSTTNWVTKGGTISSPGLKLTFKIDDKDETTATLSWSGFSPPLVLYSANTAPNYFYNDGVSETTAFGGYYYKIWKTVNVRGTNGQISQRTEVIADGTIKGNKASFTIPNDATNVYATVTPQSDYYKTKSSPIATFFKTVSMDKLTDLNDEYTYAFSSPADSLGTTKGMTQDLSVYAYFTKGDNKFTKYRFKYNIHYDRNNFSRVYSMDGTDSTTATYYLKGGYIRVGGSAGYNEIDAKKIIKYIWGYTDSTDTDEGEKMTMKYVAIYNRIESISKLASDAKSTHRLYVPRSCKQGIPYTTSGCESFSPTNRNMYLYSASADYVAVFGKKYNTTVSPNLVRENGSNNYIVTWDAVPHPFVYPGKDNEDRFTFVGVSPKNSVKGYQINIYKYTDTESLKSTREAVDTATVDIGEDGDTAAIRTYSFSYEDETKIAVSITVLSDYFTTTEGKKVTLIKPVTPDTPELSVTDASGKNVGKFIVNIDSIDVSSGINGVELSFKKEDANGNTEKSNKFEIITPDKKCWSTGALHWESDKISPDDFDYYFSVRARTYTQYDNDKYYSDWSEYSSAVTITSTSFPPQLPINPTAEVRVIHNELTNKDDKKLLIKWGLTSSEPNTGKVTKTVISYSDSIEQFNTGITTDVEVDMDQIIMDANGIYNYYLNDIDFSSAKEYYLKIKTVNDTDESEPLIFPNNPILVGSKPNAPTLWSASTQSMDEDITVYWSHSSSDGGNMTGFILELLITPADETLESVKMAIGTYESDDNKITEAGYEMYIPVNFIIGSQSVDLGIVEFGIDKNENGKIAINMLNRSSSGDINLRGDETISEFKLRLGGTLTAISATIGVQIITLGATGDESPKSNITLTMYKKPDILINIDTDASTVENDNILTSYSNGFHIDVLMYGENVQFALESIIQIKSNRPYSIEDDFGNTQYVNAGDVIFQRTYMSDQIVTDIDSDGKTYQRATYSFDCTSINLVDRQMYTVSAIVLFTSGYTVMTDDENNYTFTVNLNSTTDTMEVNADLTYNETNATVDIIPYGNVSINEGESKWYKAAYSTKEDEDGNILWYNVSLTSTFKDGIKYAESVDGEIYEEGGSYLSSDMTHIFIDSDIRDIDTNEPAILDAYKNSLSVFISADGQAYINVPSMISDLSDYYKFAIYRIQHDGEFVLIEDMVDSGTIIQDERPTLDVSNYRVIMTDMQTGRSEYNDFSIPINNPNVIIQWGQYTLELPFNIDISASSDRDVELVEYIGRSSPVGYYGTQIGESISISADIPKTDRATLNLIKQLSRYMGDVYVREPYGSSYWASVSVSYTLTHCELTIPISIEVTRVEGGD